MILTLIGLYVFFCAVFFFHVKRAPMGVEDDSGFHLTNAAESALKPIPLTVQSRRQRAAAAAPTTTVP